MIFTTAKKAKLANNLMQLSNDELNNELYFIDVNPLIITQSNNALTYRFNVVHHLENIGKLREWLEHLSKKYTFIAAINEELAKVNQKPFPTDISLDTTNSNELDLYNSIMDDLSKGLSIADLHHAINRTSGPNSVDNIVNTNDTKAQQIQKAIAFYISRRSLGKFLNSIKHRSINPVALSAQTITKIWKVLGIVADETQIKFNNIPNKAHNYSNEITIDTFKQKLKDNFDEGRLRNFIFDHYRDIYDSIANIDAKDKNTLIRMFLDKCPKVKYQEVSEKIDENI